MQRRKGPSSSARRRNTCSLLSSGMLPIRWRRSLVSMGGLHSRHLLELLQRTQVLRHRHAGMRAGPVGVAHFADIDVALAVDGEAVRRQEAAGFLAGTMLAAQPRDQTALLVDDGKSRADVGVLAVDRHARPQLADDEFRVLAAAGAAIERTRPVHVVPLQLVLAIAVEYLHAMVFAVGDVDPAILVGGDVVSDVELAGIGAGGAPAHQVLAVRRIFVDAGIAVAVGNVDLALGREGGMG